MFQTDNKTTQSNAAHAQMANAGLSVIRDSFAPKSKNISDVFAEAARTKAIFEVVPTVANFNAFDFAVGEIKVTLHLTPNNPFYLAHMDRYEALATARRELKAKYQPSRVGR